MKQLINDGVTDNWDVLIKMGVNPQDLIDALVSEKAKPIAGKTAE